MELDKIKRKSENSGIRIVFPEGSDSRIARAAEIISDKNYARVKLIDSGSNVLTRAAKMVEKGEADAMVAGASHATAEVFKVALRIISEEEKKNLISSFFLMESENTDIGESGAFLFADCALIPRPDEKQLADIAYSTAKSAEKLLGWEPKVAFLSFSTKGSSTHPEAKKLVRAVEELEKRKPDFVFDGEIQLDAAIVPSVAAKKDSRGKLKGRANILIFPGLNSANIGYKIAERIGRMKAVGPIMQGFRKPVNDLSRGCSVDDIVSVACFTALQASVPDKK